MKSQAKPLLSLFLFILAVSLLGERFLSQQTFSLSSTDSWYGLKRVGGQYMQALMGSEEFLSRREPVAKNVLDLGAWHGYADVLYKEPIKEPSLITYDLHFSPKSYVWIFLRKSADRVYGVRISTRDDFTSGFFEISEQGKFLAAHVSLFLIEPGQHKIYFEYKGDKVTVLSEKTKMGEYTLPPGTDILRVRGSDKSVLVKQVEVNSRSGKNLKLDFSPPFSFVFFFGFLAILAIGFSLVLWSATSEKLRTRLVQLHALTILLFISIFLVKQFDQSFWRDRYAVEGLTPWDAAPATWMVECERIRMRIADFLTIKKPTTVFTLGPTWYEESEPRTTSFMDRTYPQVIHPDGKVEFIKSVIEAPPEDPKVIRVALLGTSQTWGAGASRMKYVWPSLLTTGMTQKFQRPFLTVNFAVAGSRLPLLLHRSDEIIAFDPQIIIVVLGVNDMPFDLGEFRANLEKLISLLSPTKALLVFASEPMSPESDLSTQFQGNIMKALASETGSLYVESSFYFDDHKDSGLMWWDLVHFDNWGHQLMASNFLENKAFNDAVKSLMAKRKP